MEEDKSGCTNANNSGCVGAIIFTILSYFFYAILSPNGLGYVFFAVPVYTLPSGYYLGLMVAAVRGAERKRAGQGKKLLAVFLLVFAALYGVWHYSNTVTESTNTTRLRPSDMEGIFYAHSKFGFDQSCLMLGKNGKLRARLVDPSGHIVKQSKGWWRLIRQGNGEQKIQYYGEVVRCRKEAPEVCVSGGIYTIDNSDGQIIIHADFGHYLKQKASN